MSFTPLSYIESSGTQYIDTGVAPTASTMAVLRYCFTGLTHFADVLLGCRNAAGDMSSRFYPASLNGSALDERCVLGATTLLHSHAEQAVHLVAFNDENHAVLLDGAQLGTLPVSGFTPPGRSMYLFSGRNTDGPDWFAVARLYDCRITDTSTGTLLRHFRPALDERGVACLWDTVTERYFYNAGTGDFTWAAAPPDFDKKQFLAGLALGRQMKGWSAGSGGDGTAGDGKGIGYRRLDLRCWARVSCDPAIAFDGTDNVLTITTVGGSFERLYCPVMVKPNCDYRFSIRFAGSFQEGNREGAHSYLIVAGSLLDNTYIENQPAKALAMTRLYSDRPGLYTVDFNSGERGWVYLYIDLAAVKDATTVTLTYGNVSFLVR